MSYDDFYTFRIAMPHHIRTRPATDIDSLYDEYVDDFSPLSRV